MPEDTWYRKGPAFDRLPIGNEPKGGVPIGVPESEALGIYLNDEAADFIAKYIMADNQRAMGGLLVGYVASAQRPFILISGAIEARDAEIVNGCVTFTDQSWEYMRQVWDREYPNTFVVGWFCSHPGYGISVTGYERFTHHRTFNRPWQLIFVVDPVANTSLFYRWSDDRLEPVANITVWNARKEPTASLLPSDALLSKTFVKHTHKAQPTPLKNAQAEVAAAEENVPVKHSISPWSWLIVILLAFLFFWPSLPWSVTHLWSAASERRSELLQLQEQLNEADDDDQTNTPASDTATPSSGPDPQSATFDTQPTSIEPSANAADSGSRASPQSTANSASTYEVQSGDTLWGISEKATGNPLEYHRLAKTNGIDDPSLIHPGTELQLDIKD